MLLTEADVTEAAPAFAADAVLVQLQQPPLAALAAARLAREAALDPGSGGDPPTGGEA